MDPASWQAGFAKGFGKGFSLGLEYGAKKESDAERAWGSSPGWGSASAGGSPWSQAQNWGSAADGWSPLGAFGAHSQSYGGSGKGSSDWGPPGSAAPPSWGARGADGPWRSGIPALRLVGRIAL